MLFFDSSRIPIKNQLLILIFFFLLAIKNVVGFLCVGVVVENDGIVYRKSASKYRVCQKIVHFYSLMWIPPSLPMDCRAFSALPLSQATQLRTALWTTLSPPVYTVQTGCNCAKSVLNSRFFFLLSSQFSYLPKHCRALRRLRQFSGAICSVPAWRLV